jgi:hypothetical protein
MTTTSLLTETQRAEVRGLIEHLLRVLVPPTSSPVHHIPQSPPYTVALPGHGQIVDALGTTWAVTAGGKITVAGTVDPVTGGVARLIYEGGHIWQLALPYGWYQKSEAVPGTAWAHDAKGPVSADGTKVTDPHDGIIDSKGYVAQRTSGGQIRVDGTVDPVTKGVELLQYHNKQLWQQIADGSWYHTTLPSTAWTYSATGPGEEPIQRPSSGHVHLGVQCGDPWGAGGGCSNIMGEFTSQMGESPVEFCSFLEEHTRDWRNSAAYSASGIVHANSFPGCGKLIVASVGVPLVNKESTWQHDFPAIARGEWDSVLCEALDEYANNNLEIMIRPGWEMNGNWYRWSVTPENAGQFVEAFRRIAQTAHGYKRKKVAVCWNPGYIPGGSTDYTTFYPGDEYVDYIGIDTYGAASGVPNDSPFATYNDNRHWCVDDAIKFSIAHNKPLCFPETGCGPNDLDFPKNLAQKIQSTAARINLFSIWDQQTGVGEIGGHWSQNPACGAAWKDCLAKIRKTNSW